MTEPSRRDFLRGLACVAIGARLPPVRTPRVRTVAGIGEPGYRPEGGRGADAAHAPITNPFGVVVGPDGALYFCELDTGRTRRVDLRTGRMTTIAGDGGQEFRGDGGPALRASFTTPHEIRFDSGGDLHVVERDTHVVRRVTRRGGMVSTVVGTGAPGFSGDGGPASLAQLRYPHSIAFGAGGELLICDIGNARIRAVDPADGRIRTWAGTGDRMPTPAQGPLEGTPLQGPRSLDTDPAGNVYLVLREGNAVYRLDPRAGRLWRIAGTGEKGFGGDGGPASEATLNGPKGIAYSGADHALYLVDTENHAIRRLQLATGRIDTVLGTGEEGDGPDGDPLHCALRRPHGVYMHRGVLYVTDSENHRIRAVEGLV